MINVTFYNDRVPQDIADEQYRVFSRLGLKLKQVKSENWQGHGGEIDLWMNRWRDLDFNEVIIIWDIDCIPINVDIVNEATAFADAGGIMGVAQKASHIPDSIIYAGPAFLCFSLATWKSLGCPTFAATERADCAGELTYAAREKGIEVRLLYPSHVEKEEWQLDGPIMFGRGTTFNNVIYHGFLSRKGNTEGFIKKCKEVYEKQLDQAN